MKFRKKPVVIEAHQWPFAEDVPTEFYEALPIGPRDPTPYIKTLEGKLYVQMNDWIIKGVKGEFYPCKPDIFEMTYEAVNE